MNEVKTGLLVLDVETARQRFEVCLSQDKVLTKTCVYMQGYFERFGLYPSSNTLVLLTEGLPVERVSDWDFVAMGLKGQEENVAQGLRSGLMGLEGVEVVVIENGGFKRVEVQRDGVALISVDDARATADYIRDIKREVEWGGEQEDDFEEISGSSLLTLPVICWQNKQMSLVGSMGSFSGRVERNMCGVFNIDVVKKLMKKGNFDLAGGVARDITAMMGRLVYLACCVDTENEFGQRVISDEMWADDIRQLIVLSGRRQINNASALHLEMGEAVGGLNLEPARLVFYRRFVKSAEANPEMAFGRTFRLMAMPLLSGKLDGLMYHAFSQEDSNNWRVFGDFLRDPDLVQKIGMEGVFVLAGKCFGATDEEFEEIAGDIGNVASVPKISLSLKAGLSLIGEFDNKRALRVWKKLEGLRVEDCGATMLDLYN